MPAKTAFASVAAKATAKPVPTTAAKPRAKSARMSKLEARRLESFKAFMKKYGGKLSFAGCDE